MEWSEEIILDLIDLYRKKTLLWDPKHKEHYKKNLKEDAWREIGVEMKKNADQCKKKMISFLASYRREKTKIKNSKGTGKGSDEIYVTKWFAYEAFKFLEDRDEPRERLNTEMEGTTEVENDNEEENLRVQETTTPSSSLKRTKQARGKQDETSPSMMKSAFEILTNAASKFDNKPSSSNEVDSFFNYVAAKVNKYCPETQKAVQYYVFELLMKADRGNLNMPAANDSNLANWQNPAGSASTPSMFYGQPQYAIRPTYNQNQFPLHQPQYPIQHVIPSPLNSPQSPIQQREALSPASQAQSPLPGYAVPPYGGPSRSESASSTQQSWEQSPRSSDFADYV